MNASAMDNLENYTPQLGTLFRSRGPKTGGLRNPDDFRKLVNYRWSWRTRRLVHNEALKLGVTKAALTEMLVTMGLENSEFMGKLREMVELNK